MLHTRPALYAPGLTPVAGATVVAAPTGDGGELQGGNSVRTTFDRLSKAFGIAPPTPRQRTSKKARGGKPSPERRPVTACCGSYLGDCGTCRARDLDFDRSSGRPARSGRKPTSRSTAASRGTAASHNCTASRGHVASSSHTASSSFPASHGDGCSGDSEAHSRGSDSSCPCANQRTRSRLRCPLKQTPSEVPHPLPLPAPGGTRTSRSTGLKALGALSCRGSGRLFGLVSSNAAPPSLPPSPSASPRSSLALMVSSNNSSGKSAMPSALKEGQRAKASSEVSCDGCRPDALLSVRPTSVRDSESNGPSMSTDKHRRTSGGSSEVSCDMHWPDALLPIRPTSVRDSESNGPSTSEASSPPCATEEDWSVKAASSASTWSRRLELSHKGSGGSRLSRFSTRLARLNSVDSSAVKAISKSAGIPNGTKRSRLGTLNHLDAAAYAAHLKDSSPHAKASDGPDRLMTMAEASSATRVAVQFARTKTRTPPASVTAKVPRLLPFQDATEAHQRAALASLQAADIWAYGQLLCVIGRRVCDMMMNAQSKALNQQPLVQMLQHIHGKRSPVDGIDELHLPGGLHKLATSCCTLEPSLRPQTVAVLAELRTVLSVLCASAVSPPRPTEPLVGYISGKPGEGGSHQRTLMGLAKDAVRQSEDHLRKLKAATDAQGGLLGSTTHTRKEATKLDHNTGFSSHSFEWFEDQEERKTERIGLGASHTPTSPEEAARRRARRESLDGGLSRRDLMAPREGPGRSRSSRGSSRAGRMQTFSFAVGTRVRHEKRGPGVVTELMDDGRTRVQFDNGDQHRYNLSSMHKLSAEHPARPQPSNGEAMRKLSRKGAIKDLAESSMRAQRSTGGAMRKLKREGATKGLAESSTHEPSSKISP